MSRYAFNLEEHRDALVAVLDEVWARPDLDDRGLEKLVRKQAKLTHRMYSKSELIRGARAFAADRGWTAPELVARLRMKPIRSLSGVAPVTVLTRPHPCPGRCVFCPNDVRMPKSYLSMEPGAQRAAQFRFDPFAQTRGRMAALHANGHVTSKVEMIILGGTWSSYPHAYQRWFVKRCFDAMNEPALDENPTQEAHDLAVLVGKDERAVDYFALPEVMPPSKPGTYNRMVQGFFREHALPKEECSWEELEATHRQNEAGVARCVGMSVETRPELVDMQEALRLRRLGVTKVQIGVQNVSDEILKINQRDHSIEDARRALRILRAAGFKLQIHWMPNLLGATPEHDIEDFGRLMAEPDLQPDELKIYPCVLIESAELSKHHQSGEWSPYSAEDMMRILVACLKQVPRNCRVTRVVRDIPGHDIVAGATTSNLRETVEAAMDGAGTARHDIRSREIRSETFGKQTDLETIWRTSTTSEVFVETSAAAVDADGKTTQDRLLGFARLSLPEAGHIAPDELGAAVLREVHVYGPARRVGTSGGGLPQHTGLGRALVERARVIADKAGHKRLSVISSVGTRDYYRNLGFEDGDLYQHLSW